MDRLPTTIDRESAEFASRLEHNFALCNTLRSTLDLVKQGGGEKYVQRHRERGKNLPRERITEICDPATSFLELSSLAAHELYDGRAHSAGIVTGIGVVHGRECMFVAVSYTHLTLPTKA